MAVERASPHTVEVIVRGSLQKRTAPVNLPVRRIHQPQSDGADVWKHGDGVSDTTLKSGCRAMRFASCAAVAKVMSM